MSITYLVSHMSWSFQRYGFNLNCS